MMPIKVNKPKYLLNLLIIFVGVIIALIVGEISIRIFFPSLCIISPENKLYIWPPNLRKIFKPMKGVMPGISGPSRLHINSAGIRGDEFNKDQQHRILAIGGSTTECIYLDQVEAWPYRIQQILNNDQKKVHVWVGNIGRSGFNTRDHIVVMRYIIPQYPRIDALLILLGINDLVTGISQVPGRNKSEQETFLKVFGHVPGEKGSVLPFYKKTALYNLLRKFKVILVSAALVQDKDGEFYMELRRRRRNASIIRNTLPDLSLALAEYAKNINIMIDLAQKLKTRPVFITQPTIWRAGLPDKANDLLWYGGIGNFQAERVKEYYSVEALADAMSMYNNTLLRVCEEREVECIDLASLLPKDTSVFYDDCHFHENGAWLVAEAISHYLLQREPFTD